jgi:hypothetical protein
MGRVMASVRLLLLLSELKWTALPLFWGVTMRTEDSGLERSLSFGSLLMLSSWV